MRKIRYSSVKQRGDVRGWKNKLVNVPAFIVGNGPSLNDQDIASLNSYFTIGINRAFYKIDPTILMWQDPELIITDKREVLQTKAIKFCTSRGDPENRFHHFKIEGGFSLPTETGILHGGGTTAPLSVQLAYLLGCNPIVLLGCDCQNRGSDTNFYGKNSFHNANTLSYCRSGLQWVKTDIDDKNIRKIISCSDNTVFERKSLESVLSSVDAKHKQSREYWTQILQ